MLAVECIMIRMIELAVGAALVLGTATASFAESPYGAQAISPSVPVQGGVRRDASALRAHGIAAAGDVPACRLDLDHAAPGSAGGQGRSAALRKIRRPRRPFRRVRTRDTLAR